MKRREIENDDDILPLFHKELRKVEESHRLLVIVTHGFIELLINSIIFSKLKHSKKKITSNNRDYSHSVKLVILHELNLIDDELYIILEWFRKIRNRAAHDPFFKFTKSDFVISNKSLDKFIIGESKKKPNNLLHFCSLLIGKIWNENLDTLLSIFNSKSD